MESVRTTEHTKIAPSIHPKKDSLKLERMQLPKFNGSLRDYIRFKDDFTKFVIPEVEAEKAAYVLKSCLDPEPYKYVKNIENSIDKVWERLDERYGQPSRLAEQIVNEIKRYKVLNDNNDKGLVEFIEAIEGNYTDLKLVGMEDEISSLSMVSLIEEKLPSAVKRKWAEEISKDDSKVDKRKPFPSLLNFLKQQRRIIEYVSADLRTQGYVTKHNNTSNNDHDSLQKGCWIHKSNGHYIASCSQYLNKSDTERIAFLKENQAYWICLTPGHRCTDCPKRSKCSVENCNKYHSETLHNACVDGLIFKTDAYDCNTGHNHVAFQIMSIPTLVTESSVNVFWDGGSNCSLITFQKAEELKLIGKPMKLRIRKIGEEANESEIIDSISYTLYLVTKDDKSIPFKVYGIESISNNIKPIDKGNIKHLFPNTDLHDVRMIKGEIDVLIGLEYAGLHPQIIASNNNLIISANVFGKCISGIHPLVKRTHPFVHNITINF